MKKLLILILSFMFLSTVKAETTPIYINSTLPDNNFCSLSGCDNTYEQAYQEIMEYYNSKYKEKYPYYALTYQYIQANKFVLIASSDNSYTFNATAENYSISLSENSISIMHTFADNSFVTSGHIYFDSHSSSDNGAYYSLIDSNIDFIVSGNKYIFNGFYQDDIELNIGDRLPLYNNLIKYDSWADYVSDNSLIYTTVNLDDYEYVILNLKSYIQKDSFSSNLQVKEMIGITPVYEFGTIEKETITDRCSVSYSDYTDYRFFILKNDIVNNAVYIVKSCQDGSSFKFDSTKFSITYVTADNVDDPVITVGGEEHHTIPFDQLTNTANKNEEENFIPGASEDFRPFESLTDYISDFWNSLTTLMGLVTKLFNTLPIEIRAISITAFTTAVTLGLIKFIKS